MASEPEPLEEVWWPSMVGAVAFDRTRPDPTQKQLKRWRAEDAERDRKRIPPGFRPPDTELPDAA